jgi:hypothetical protein
MSSGIAVAAEHDAAGRHGEAINELAIATHRGDVEAMTELGKRLILGDRAPQMPKDGAQLLLEAVKAGNAEAALRLANLVALGAHIDQSWTGAISLLVVAAERGSASAQGQLNTLAGRPAGESAPSEGWRGLAHKLDLGAWLAPCEGKTLCESPLVRSFAEFVPEQACGWLIERARGRLKRALIYNPEQGGDVADEMRTNTAAGFDLIDADLVQIAIQYRMAAAVGLPVHNMEGPTVLHYDIGEQITNHTDFLNPKIPNYADEVAKRGERIITFLVYLNDDYGGGETDFHLLSIRHKGRRREGLFFTNALPNGRPDTRMVHAGMPPTSGEKWIISQFIRNRAVLNSRAERVA